MWFLFSSVLRIYFAETFKEIGRFGLSGKKNDDILLIKTHLKERVPLWIEHVTFLKIDGHSKLRLNNPFKPIS